MSKKNVNESKKNNQAQAEVAPVKPSAAAVAANVGIEVKKRVPASTIRRLRRSLPGYAGVLAEARTSLAEDAGVLTVSDVTPEDVASLLARRKPLADAEAVLTVVLRSAYEQRLLLDDEGMGMMRKINSAVADSNNPELATRYKFLRDYLAAFAGGVHKSTSPVDAPAPEPQVTASRVKAG